MSVRAFAVGKYEVTVAEFERFVRDRQYRTDAEQSDGCRTWSWADGEWTKVQGRDFQKPGFEQQDSSPVVCLSWNDATAYAQCLSTQTGAEYRLPTEAEWEYATRAGTTTARFWGDNQVEACAYGNVADKEARRRKPSWPVHDCNDGYFQTAPVDASRFKPNAFGLYHPLGNVWEWVQDCWHGAYDGAPTDGRLWGEENGGDCGQRVLRGGSWGSNPAGVRSANRNWLRPVARNGYVGLRLARTLK